MGKCDPDEALIAEEKMYDWFIDCLFVLFGWLIDWLIDWLSQEVNVILMKPW